MQPTSQVAGKLYNDALRAAQPEIAPLAPIAPDAEGGASFSETLAEVTVDTVQALKTGETAAQDMMAGRADPHSVVEALAATEMALEMAVNVRNKVVEAYQEILRMPV